MRGLAAVIGIILLLHYSTAVEMHRFWSDSDNTTYSHGYLIVAIVIWLIWRRRALLTRTPVEPEPRAIIPLLCAEILWLVASQAGVQGLCMLLLPAIIWLAALAVLGSRTARLLFFPLGYLGFALPIWSLINPAAQWLTIHATRLSLSAAGVHASFEANLVHLRSGTFEIAGGCSGLHFIIVALSLAALLGELREERLRMRMKLIGLALLLAVLSNWVRVFVIILAGDLTDMQHYLVRVSHYGFGWAVFAVAMALFFVLERRLKTVVRADELARVDVNAPGCSPQVRGLAWAGAGAVVALPLIISSVISGRQQLLTVSLPANPDHWSGPVTEDGTEWRPVFLGADAEAHGTYARDSRRVEVYSAWYSVQMQGRELSGFYNSLFGELSPTDAVGIQTEGKRPFNEIQLRSKTGQTSTLWYGYEVAGRWFRNPTRAQLWYALQTIFRLKPVASRVLAVRAPCLPDCAAAEQSIAGFLAVDIL